MNRLLAIVGPTATGKSRLGLHLAQLFNGELVSADSRQIYHHMDIGTAKPSPAELSLVPHHLINIVDPDQEFSLGQYQKLAYQAITDIQQRQKLPILVGGSGQYVWSVVEGWQIPPVPPDPELRQHLEEKAARCGIDALYQELARVDPIAAEKIDRHNPRRIIRALEIYHRQPSLLSRRQPKVPPAFPVMIIGLTNSRNELYRRIDLRVDGMVAQGLVAEVQRLIDMGYRRELPAMSSIGYRQVGQYLSGELSLDGAIERIKYQTHRLVRQQYNWFRLRDNRITWFDMMYNIDAEAAAVLAEFVSTER